MSELTYSFIEDRQTSAVSDTASYLIEVSSIARRHFDESAIGSRFADVEKSIETVWREAYKADWDGPGSLPVGTLTYQNALAFIRGFPIGFKNKPSVYAEAGGGIGFDWENDLQESLTVLAREGRLVYSALLKDGDRARGIIRFRDNKLPTAILNILDQMFPTSHS